MKTINNYLLRGKQSQNQLLKSSYTFIKIYRFNYTFVSWAISKDNLINYDAYIVNSLLQIIVGIMVL